MVMYVCIADHPLGYAYTSICDKDPDPSLPSASRCARAAEQFLLANAVHHGERGLRRLAVSAAPCGHCRQFYSELACAVRVASAQGVLRALGWAWPWGVALVPLPPAVCWELACTVRTAGHTHPTGSEGGGKGRKRGLKSLSLASPTPAPPHVVPAPPAGDGAVQLWGRDLLPGPTAAHAVQARGPAGGPRHTPPARGQCRPAHIDTDTPGK